MKQTTFYKYAIWGLVLLNMLVLAFFVFTKPKPPHSAHSHNFQSEVIHLLKLDPEQQAAFRKLAESHNQNIKLLSSQQEKLLLPYFESLTDSTQYVDKVKNLNQFQLLERQKIETTYQHFEEIKNILHQEQLPRFEEFMKIIIDNLLLKNKKNPPPPKEF